MHEKKLYAGIKQKQSPLFNPSMHISFFDGASQDNDNKSSAGAILKLDDDYVIQGSVAVRGQILRGNSWLFSLYFMLQNKKAYLIFKCRRFIDWLLKQCMLQGVVLESWKRRIT